MGRPRPNTPEPLELTLLSEAIAIGGWQRTMVFDFPDRKIAEEFISFCGGLGVSASNPQGCRGAWAVTVTLPRR